MSNGNAAVARQMGRLFDEGTLAGLTEGQLLDRFLQRRDESAFEALVERHSPLVMGVCRRVLGNPHDAEDAFQATFLLLARKAGSVRHRKLLSGWLHRVAYRVATRSGQSASRRRAVEKVDSETAEKAVSPAGPSPDLSRILHEELARLSDNDRAAVVLCDLEGLSHSEAAARLNWPVGTVKGRLSRARERLRGRLVRRGLSLPAGLVASSLAAEAKASVSRALITSTVHAAALASAGQAVSGAASASAVALATGVARTMMVNQMKIFASLFLAGSLVAAGAGAVLLPDGKGPKGDPPKPEAAQAPEPEVKKPPEPEAAETDMPPILGVWKVLYVERGGKIERAGFSGQPSALRFDEDGTFRVHEPSPSKSLQSLLKEAKYTVDPDAKPATIDLKVQLGATTGELIQRGIYRIDGDTMSLCLFVAPIKLGPGQKVVNAHARPNGFETAPSFDDPERADHRLLLVLKRGTEDDFAPKDQKAINELVGTWRCVDMVQDGHRDLHAPEEIGEIVILPGRIFWGGSERKVWRYILNPNASPKQIDLHVQDKGDTLGIYERDGELLRFGVSTTGIRPQSFDQAGQTPTSALTTLRYVGPPRAIDFEALDQPSNLPDASPAPPSAPAQPEAAPPPPIMPEPAAPAPERQPDAQPAVELVPLPAVQPAPIPEPPKPEAGQTRQARSEKRALVVQLAKPAPGISKEERDQLQNRLAQYRERESVLMDEAAAHRQALAKVEERVAPLEGYISSRNGGEKVNRALAKLLLGDQAEAVADLSEEELRQVQKLSQDAKDRAEKVVENWAHLIEDARLNMDLLRRKLEAPLAEPRKVKPGDVLIVEVLEALPGRPITGERMVRTDGTISLGFYGDVAVAGLDRNQIKERIVVHLREFLDDKVLGLVERDENGQEISVPPAESDRVFVDESARESIDTRDAKIEALERRLERAVEEIESLRRHERP